MAAGIALEVTNIEKVELAVRALNELDQKQKALALSAAGVATGVGRAGARGHDVFAGWTKGAMGLAMSLTGIHSGVSLVTKAIELARADYEKLVELQKEAATTQQTWGEAVGTFIANNPQLSPKEAKTWTDLAQGTGSVLGAQGPQKVMSAITELRSGTPGASDEQQKDAIKRAVMQARLDPKTNIGEFATGLVKAQQSTGLNATQASNLLGMFGARAGGDIGQLVEHIGKLSGGTAAHGTPLDQVLGLFGFSTAELGDRSGNASVTNVNNLLTRIQTRQLKLNGRNVALEGQTGFDKLMNLMDRIDKGEFGDKQKAIANVSRSLGRGSAETTALLGAILQGRGRLDESVGMIRSAVGTEDMLQRQIEMRNQLVPGGEQMERGKATAGTTTRAQLLGDEADIARAKEDIAEFKKTLGYRTVFGIGGKLRGAAASYGMAGTGEQYEQSERLALLKAQAQREMNLSTGGAVGGGMAGWSGSDADRRRYAEAQQRYNAIMGAQNERELLTQVLMQGGVQPGKGISGLEMLALEAGGATQEQLSELGIKRDAAKKSGDMAEFTKAVQELVAALQEAVRQGARDGVSAGKRESTPADAGKAVD